MGVCVVRLRVVSVCSCLCVVVRDCVSVRLCVVVLSVVDCVCWCVCDGLWLSVGVVRWLCVCGCVCVCVCGCVIVCVVHHSDEPHTRWAIGSLSV